MSFNVLNCLMCLSKVYYNGKYIINKKIRNFNINFLPIKLPITPRLEQKVNN